MPQSFKSPLLGSSAGPMLQFSPSLFATPVATTVDASVVTHAVGIGTPVPPSGEPQATTHDRRETKATTPLVPKTTGTHTWSSISSSPQQPHDSLATVNPVVGGGSAQRAHSNYSVTTTPLAFSMTAKSSPFLLSSTPPFLHDSATSDEQSEGEREEEREEEGEGENDHHLVLSASTSHGGLGRDEAIGPEEKQLTGPTGAQKESLTDLHTELKPNGIPLGLQIPSSVQLSGLAVESPSPSTSALASTRHTSSPAWGGVQLIDLSLPPGLDEREWRPLDVSEDHSNSLSPSPPHNQSFKCMLLYGVSVHLVFHSAQTARLYLQSVLGTSCMVHCSLCSKCTSLSLPVVGDKHQLSSSGDGLFGESCPSCLGSCVDSLYISNGVSR